MTDNVVAAIPNATIDRVFANLDDEIRKAMERCAGDPATWEEVQGWVHGLDDDAVGGAAGEIVNTILEWHSDLAGADAEFYRVVTGFQIFANASRVLKAELNDINWDYAQMDRQAKRGVAVLRALDPAVLQELRDTDMLAPHVIVRLDGREQGAA